MAVYHQGMTDEFIKRIQQVLKEAGYYRGAIDGIFGPQTFAAVKGWQHQNNLTVDGIVGPQTLAAMGLSGSSSPGSGSTGETIGISPSPSGGGAASGDATDDPNTRFVGLPGHPKVWRDSKTGDVYIVYTVDNLKPPVPLLWKVPSEADLKVFFGNKPITYDRTLTTQQIISAGGVIWGSTDQILAFEGHPWAGFHERMERAMETQPWLRDPEVYAVYAGAWMEGRAPEKWELESTDWWQSHNEAQQEWLWLAARNPTEAERVLDDNYLQVYEAFQSLGIDTPNSAIVKYISEQFTHGNWSQAYVQQQLDELVWGDGAIPLDEGLQKYMKDQRLKVGDPEINESQIIEEWRKWMGPAFTPSDLQVREWGERIRREGEYGADALQQYLQQQRLAKFPTYQDPTLTYEQIAAPWRSIVSNTWGQAPDETDAVFMKVLEMNDSVEAGKLLRKVGMERGYEAVSRSALDGLFTQSGGQIRRAV